MEDQDHSHIHMHMDVSHTLSRSLPFASRFSPCLSLFVCFFLSLLALLSCSSERDTDSSSVRSVLAREAREERALL